MHEVPDENSKLMSVSPKHNTRIPVCTLISVTNRILHLDHGVEPFLYAC
jgi:hypothetical protein